VLGWRLKRWSGLASDLTIPHLRKQFRSLARTKHVVIDDDHEELLIRTYVGHDGLLAQPLVVAAMVRDFQTVTSPTIRTAILAELRRLWDDDDTIDTNRRGLLLLLGVDPATLDLGGPKPEQVSRIRKAIGEGLSKETAEAIREGLVDPYLEGPVEGLPEGLPDPLTRVHLRGPARAHPRMSPSPTPSPTPIPIPDPPDDDTAWENQLTPQPARAQLGLATEDPF
jgi:hypothetical protein